MTFPLTGVDALDAQRLQLIANTVPALLAYVDEQARYVWVNEAYRRWFGYPPDSLRGRHVREIVGEVAWSMLEPHVTRASTGENVSFEAHLGFGAGAAGERARTHRARGFDNQLVKSVDVAALRRIIAAPRRIAGFVAAVRRIRICHTRCIERGAGFPHPVVRCERKKFLVENVRNG